MPATQGVNPALVSFPRYQQGSVLDVNFTRDDDTVTGRAFTVTAKNTGTFASSDVGPTPYGLVSGAPTTDDSGSNFLSTVALIGMGSGVTARLATQLELSEATQSELYFGYVSSVTDLSAGFNHGFLVRKADGSTNLDLVVRKSAADVSTLTIHTVVAATPFSLGIEVIGIDATRQTLNAYINGVFAGSIERALGPITSDEVLRMGGQFLSGDNVGTRTCKVWPIHHEVHF